MSYVYSDYGYIETSIYSLGVKCDEFSIGSENNYSFRYFFLPFTIFILAIFDIILNIKYIYEVIGLYT